MTKKSETKAPTLIAWHVREAKGGKAFWTRVGAAWQHQNSDGHTLQLDLYPLDGRIVLLPPKAGEVAEGGAA
ncbi:hypothetical protein [Sphingobium cloacae]|uniref:hypothetical protein n=1 Tax=Sphingobium cloacae TaxID=120107 RepID=UPI000836876A|nr:hypothetical protein [Sphingobium cloacae]